MSLPLTNAKKQYLNQGGSPLAGGTVAYYIPNTLTPVNTYQDQGLTILNSNPVILDANGQAVVWIADGTSVREIVKDNAGNQIWDQITAIGYGSSGLGAPSGSSLVGFIQAGTGSVARTMQDKARELAVSVKDFGAKGDNSTDDTAAIQAALNASTKVYFPDGIYVVSATLTVQANTKLYGSTPETCRLHRSTVYGDTIRTANPAGAFEVDGIWFWHTETFNNGSTYVAGTSNNILNNDTNSCHLNIISGQNIRVTNCWFWGVGTQIQITDGSVFWIDRCSFNGYWDRYIAGLQETRSSLSIVASVPGTTESQLGVVTNCHFAGGGPAAPQSVTIGNVTQNVTFNCGPQYGIYVGCCESLVIADNYIGGQATNSIKVEANGIVSHIRIHDNMMDASALYSILFTSLSSSYLPSFINIHNNTGVGYGFEQGFVKFQDSGSGIPAGAYINISDNTAQYYTNTPIYIQNALGVKISNNVVAAYNSFGSTTSDFSVQAGCFVGSSSKHIHSTGNSWGGGINSPLSANNCKWGIAFQTTDASYSAANEQGVNLGLAGGSVCTITQTYPT